MCLGHNSIKTPKALDSVWSFFIVIHVRLIKTNATVKGL